MRKDLMERFWKELIVPIQEDMEDATFANPSDVARSLIKARNWTATISQELVTATQQIAEERRFINYNEDLLAAFERKILAGAGKIPPVAGKNRETLRAYIRSICLENELELLNKLEETIREHKSTLEGLMAEKETAEIMRKALEKSTDWLVQYINWHKFELRELNN